MKKNNMTLLDYVMTKTEKISEKFPITVLDIAVLNELGYLSFGEWIDVFNQESLHFLVDFREALQSLCDYLTYDFMITRERVDLLRAVLVSPRFEELQLGFYVNEVDLTMEKQFAALYFKLHNHYQVVFRGTDDSIIGWKEDFKLTYMREIPAHRSAIFYLKKHLKNKKNLVVSGHSKGGNLAVYATSQLSADLQSKISCVYAFDAPGVHPAILETVGYQTIVNRLILLRPQEAVVGVMLYQAIEAETVHSFARGMRQHSMMTWQVNGDEFQVAEKLAESSRQLETILHEWVEQLTNQELKLIFDIIFDGFLEHGISSLNDLSRLALLLGDISDLTPEKCAVLQKSIGVFANILSQKFSSPNRRLLSRFSLTENLRGDVIRELKEDNED